MYILLFSNIKQIMVLEIGTIHICSPVRNYGEFDKKLFTVFKVIYMC